MLNELIARGESVTLEFKRRVDSPIKIAKTLVAFANTHGGILLIGVNDNGTICGVDSEMEEMEKIEKAADFFCKPPITISYKAEYEGNNLVLLIKVEESQEKPHRVQEADNSTTVYVRVNNKSIPAGKTMIEALQYQEQTSAIADSPHNKNLKALFTFLQQNEAITVKKFAQLINISERRAGKLLNEWVREGKLLINENQKEKLYTRR